MKHSKEMRPRDFIVVAILLVLGFYFLYTSTNSLDLISENVVNIFEQERRYDMKRTIIINEVLANEGTVKSP